VNDATIPNRGATSEERILILGGGSTLATSFINEVLQNQSNAHATVLSSTLDDDLLISSDKLSIVKVDWTNYEGVQFELRKLAYESEFAGVISFLGVQGRHPIDNVMDYIENARAVYTSNVTLPVLLVQDIIKDNLVGSGSFFFMTSRAGSISERGTLEHHHPGGNNVYRSSKAALNMAVRCLAFDYANRHRFLLVHPGFFISKSNKDMKAAPTKLFADKMIKLYKSADHYSSGSFIDLETGKLISF